MDNFPTQCAAYIFCNLFEMIKRVWRLNINSLDGNKIRECFLKSVSHSTDIQGVPAKKTDINNFWTTLNLCMGVCICNDTKWKNLFAASDYIASSLRILKMDILIITSLGSSFNSKGSSFEILYVF